ncbi:carbon storage regulator [Pseudoflavonifractor sp. 524-17]|uniref:carbon storage regulator n=1 Tax=Pseudoflavonifractor sp. 524-17 TaxID=2304577 RepID=UPI001379BC75|nr:carbon storage regulator [Pseudoflavonifractor sp. 524-17]
MTMKNQRVQECRGRKEFAMLFLQMKEGEYLTIGEDIVIQVFPDSSTTARLGIKAPKEITILRGGGAGTQWMPPPQRAGRASKR